MNEEYIADRLLPQFIASSCQRLDIEVGVLSGGWVLELRKGDDTKWVVGYHFDVDGAAATMVAKDKVAAYQALQRGNVPAVAHYLARSTASLQVPYGSLDGAAHNVPYIAKPLQGSGGRRFTLHQTLQDALLAIEATPGDWTISPAVSIVQEKRIIMLNGDSLLAYIKTKPQQVDGVWMYNLGHGAQPIDEQANSEELLLARRAMKACGLRLAAVDIVTLASGDVQVLEVNAGIMMEHYARLSHKHHARAQAVYDAIVTALFNDITK
jgi:glutathione synthase/RimK-type ligase-like ATP-grasp enzyme